MERIRPSLSWLSFLSSRGLNKISPTIIAVQFPHTSELIGPNSYYNNGIGEVSAVNYEFLGELHIVDITIS